MIRRLLLPALVIFAVLTPLASGAVPEGPQLAVVTHNPRSGSALLAIGPAGDPRQKLIDQPASDRPSWSADGNLLALGATGDWEGTVVAVARMDTEGLRFFRRARLEGGDPVISPDGRSVAFARAKLVKILPGRENYLFKSSIWLLDVRTGAIRRLTRWRLATYLEPSSFSADGSKLATDVFDRRGQRAVAIDVRSGAFSLLARQAMEPTYSADGSRLAFVRLKVEYNDLPEPNRPISELWVADADGSSAQRLLRRRGFIESPSWDPSNARLAFAPNPPDFTGSLEREPGNKLMAINADGTCLTRVFTDPDLTLYGAAWRPGAGREAGPISC